MAIDVYTSSDYKWTFAEQTTFGTAVGDSVAQNGILTEGFGLNCDINFRNPPRARAQRYDALVDQCADVLGVMFQTDGMNFPAVKDQIDYWIYGLMQNVTESSGTPYAKVFTFGLDQPDFTTNEGEFFTMWQKSPVSSVSQKLHDVIVSELVLTCAPGNNEGILWAAPVCVGRTHSDTGNPSGTVTYPDFAAADQFNFYNLATTEISGSAVVLGDNGFTFTMRNNARKLGTAPAAASKFQTYALPRYDVELSIQILWDSVARGLMADARAGTQVWTDFEWGSAGVDGHLKFEANGKIMNAANLEAAVDGNFVTINIRCGGLYGTTEPFKVTHSNAIDRGW